MNIKAFVFDVDGVILKTHDDSNRYIWSKSVKEDLGLSKDHFKKIFSSRWNNVVKGKVETVPYLNNVFEDPSFKGLSITL